MFLFWANSICAFHRIASYVGKLSKRRWEGVGFSWNGSRTKLASKWRFPSVDRDFSRKPTKSLCYVMLKLLWLCSLPKENFLSIPLNAGSYSFIISHFLFLLLFLFGFYHFYLHMLFSCFGSTFYFCFIYDQSGYGNQYLYIIIYHNY